ncbi:MAG: PocR ligand-binding domain-containing protein, partial [Candidatus Gastranaerophilales bacterium]|nr:PocR ligand-binding domain-containing protein [Candidatus Gastranaerophilales bacterium]
MDIGEMIKMFNSRKKINLYDLIDITFLQKLQDDFANTLGVASLTVDESGPITKPSNFTEFCTNYIRANEIGKQRCNECDIEGGKLAVKKGEPIIYKCHAGLTHFVVPIIVEGKHIASILGGQIDTKKPDEKHFKTLAKELGIKDEKGYLRDLNKIKIIPEENIKSAMKLLSLVANSISEIAHKNYDLQIKNEREKLNGEIITKIRSTLDAEEIKRYFIDITQKYFEADRCLFVDFDKSTNKFIPFKREKLSSPEIKSLVGIDLEEEFPEFCSKLKKGKDIIVRDLEKTLSRKKLLNYRAVKTLKDNEAKSDYGLLVKCGDEIVGILIIHFIKAKRILSHDEFDFLKTIREHAGTALCQANLYAQTKLKSERENLLRTISEEIRNSLDIDKTKKSIVEVIGKTLKADRCFIMEYNKLHDKFMIINEEYLSSDELRSYKGVDLNINIPNLAKGLKQGKRLIINSNRFLLGDEKLDVNSGQFDREKEDIEKYKVYSALAFPIFYKNEFFGDLVLHYVDGKHDVGDEEINFLNLIASQIGIAIHQAKLYEKIQQQAERERISRNIIEILRSTLDKDIIKRLFVKNIGKYLNADRVFFSEFDEKGKKYLPIETQAEYLSSPEEKSFVNYDFSSSTMSAYIQPLIDGRELLIPNWKGYVENNPAPAEFTKLYEEANVQSSYNFPVLYEGRKMGYFCIEFTHKICELLEEDINRIRNICSQAGIALYHAELYMQAQEALQAKGQIIAKVKRGI